MTATLYVLAALCVAAAIWNAVTALRFTRLRNQLAAPPVRPDNKRELIDLLDRRDVHVEGWASTWEPRDPMGSRLTIDLYMDERQ